MDGTTSSHSTCKAKRSTHSWALPTKGSQVRWDALVIGPASAEDVFTTNWAMVPMTPAGLLLGLGVAILWQCGCVG